MLNGAGFVNVQIQSKEKAADIIKDWMPGSGAEKYITSVYVTATKPSDGSAPKVRDDVRAAPCCAPPVCCPPPQAGGCGPGV